MMNRGGGARAEPGARGPDGGNALGQGGLAPSEGRAQGDLRTGTEMIDQPSTHRSQVIPPREMASPTSMIPRRLSKNSASVNSISGTAPVQYPHGSQSGGPPCLSLLADALTSARARSGL
jgi:hypothetical protein